MIFQLKSGKMLLRATSKGGAIIDAFHGDTPLLRPYPNASDTEIAPLKCGSFPLVPFGNRLAKNRFTFNGNTYHLDANTDFDPLYIHGDGWLSDWNIEEQSEEHILMSIDWVGDIYSYRTKQLYKVSEHGFSIDLEIENLADIQMPFGLGHHPFFPLTKNTTLKMSATSYWTEKSDHLPDTREPIPAELDFSNGAKLPKRWINNGFEGWSGVATIEWGEEGVALEIHAPGFQNFFIYRPHYYDEEIGESPFFCFEPMTHKANGHNLKNGDMTVLARGEKLKRDMEFKVVALDFK